FEQANHMEEYKPNDFYKKFIAALDFPDLFKIDRFIMVTPEQQFYDLMDQQWGINFDTVDTYRNRYYNLINFDPSQPAAILIKEEVFNPLFREVLENKYKFQASQNESLCLKAVEKGVSLNELSQIAESSRENVLITQIEGLKRMVDTQVRKVVRTFH